LRHVEALLASREAYRDVVEMQFVVFPQTGLLGQLGTAELMDRALAMAGLVSLLDRISDAIVPQADAL
jgi:hypothetical protein